MRKELGKQPRLLLLVVLMVELGVPLGRHYRLGAPPGRRHRLGVPLGRHRRLMTTARAAQSFSKILTMLTLNPHLIT
jgi:hypothetical protein